ncbi:RNA chaperone Hfq [Mitsuokella sp.]|uniref:RNA chaperone Hfq n=1 Tax=Mitsuokella sp. TaxID=2049034 RepID=UPI0029E17A4B|nr:RNA chaperone Hfq [Mitsuokella sp.]MDD6382666.1 RNA chaperone Hfq [Selenomonadaceae bacterium]MDY4474542.1 RNA chaperone Hfq [Mitsuokella sp.]
MPNKTINLQDSFLNQVRKENIAVTIHLINGFQIKGNVKGFDNFTVVLESMGKQQMVYKHAISTITPARPVKGAFAVTGEKKSEEA